MVDYDPIECVVCGKLFKPGRKTQVTCGCPECVKKWKSRYQLRYHRNYNRKEPRITRKPKPDTIVAIGYADRQRAATLAMAGKVRTEL